MDGELSETIALSDGLRSFSKSVVFAQPQEHTYRVVAEGVGGQIRSNDLVIQWRTTLPIIDFKGELEARGDTNTAIFIIPFGVGLVTGLVNPVGGLVMFLVTFSTLIVMLDANPFLWLVVVLTAALGTAAFFMLRRV